jgi:hypothetical protein
VRISIEIDRLAQRSVNELGEQERPQPPHLNCVMHRRLHFLPETEGAAGADLPQQTAVHPGGPRHPRVSARQWVLSLPNPLRLLLPAQPHLVKPVLRVVHRVITR